MGIKTSLIEARVIFALALVAAAAAAQSVPKPVSRPPQPLAVSLETVLSCLDNPFLQAIFKTDVKTMAQLASETAQRAPEALRTGLNSGFGGDSEILQAKGFIAEPAISHTTEQSFQVAPLIGRFEQGPLFCRNGTKAAYWPDESFPGIIEIGTYSVGDITIWTLDPNEIFVHADQFKFDSGVFSDSSEVYLMATKGRVAIQFESTAKGLKFFRVLYSRESKTN